METDNPFRGYSPNLFPRLTQFAHIAGSILTPRFLPEVPLATHGDNFQQNTGAEPMLDAALDD